LALSLALSLATAALPASAGVVQFRDSSTLLTSSDEAQLRAASRSLPFDVRIVTSSAHASRTAFDEYVHLQVTEPNLVVFGIDPAHRLTSVHVGTATRIAPSETRAIEAAAAPHFKSGNFATGLEAMFKRAETAVGTARVTNAIETVPARMPAASEGGGWVSSLLPIAAVVAIGAVLVAVFAARRRSGAYTAAESMSPSPPYPYANRDGYGGYSGGYVPPGVGYGPTGSGLGGSLMSAGVGGLVGYQLGKMAGEAEHHHHRYDDDDRDSRRYADESERFAGSEVGNDDAGGSTSSWDDAGGGDFGGGDSGGDGGGSDW